MARKPDDRPANRDTIQERVTTPPVPADPNLDDATLNDPTLTDPTLNDPTLTQPTPGAASGSVPSPVGPIDDPARDPTRDPAESEGRVGVYDRPARSGPSAVVIGVIVLVLIILALVFFFR